MATKINNIYLGNAPLLDATNSSNTDIPCSYNIVKVYNLHTADSSELRSPKGTIIEDCLSSTNNVFRVFGVTSLSKYTVADSSYTPRIPFCIDLQITTNDFSSSNCNLKCVNVVYLPEGFILNFNSYGDLGRIGNLSSIYKILSDDLTITTAASLKDTTGA